MDGEDARPPAVRRRLDRPAQPHALHLARRQRPGVPRRELRRSAFGVRGPGPRPARRWRRPAAARNHLRHAERQGGDRRHRERLRGARCARPADDLGHHYRPQRPHALGPDARGVLHLDPPREAVQRRHQLRPRRPRHAPLHGGAVAPRRVLREQLPQRRPPERLRRVRRKARRDRRAAARLRRKRLRQHRRRLLRDDTRSHSGDCVGCGRCDPTSTSTRILAECPGSAPRTAHCAQRQRHVQPLQRPRTARDPPRRQLPDDR